MRPTARGWAVVAVVVAALATGWQHGPRSLNALVAPLLVVSVAAVAIVAIADRPTVRRYPVDDGFPGDRRTVAVTVETDRAIAATVRDGVGPVLTPVDGPARFETTLEGQTRLEYDVRLEGRGRRAIGPLSITVTDVFGLVSRRFVYEETSPVVVYPRVYEADGAAARQLRSRVETAFRDQRDEFDHLRAYRRGDPMRDVHWKASAKRADEDLVVAEHVADEEAGSVTVAAEGAAASADEFATAVATLVTCLLEQNVAVGLVLEGERRPPATGQDHYRAILESLATTDGSDLEARERTAGDVFVRTDESGTTITIGNTDVAFETLRGAADATRASRLAGLEPRPSSETAATPEVSV
ncbi:DUF58 domain-containing protein [Halopiger goleimassiliensis]|uniref:DUF58 domain-containing protein n=1 Tax=Halopiger goleimassiliensis TaxID=1293048 RepID=UPI00067770A1|nr:DUF58 domain-containing protein [Halopiger goleimassiliensis]